MDKLKEIISDYVDVPVSSIDDSMSLKGDIGIDSFGLISMLNDIESAYDVSIPDSALSDFQTLNDLFSFIKENSPVKA